MNDLPGQMTLFPDHEPDVADAVAALAGGVPSKATVTVPEAARVMGCSERTVELWIADGTLLVTYANRSEDAARRHPRIVTRAERPYGADRKKFLTLEELRVRRSNVSG